MDGTGVADGTNEGPRLLDHEGLAKKLGVSSTNGELEKAGTAFVRLFLLLDRLDRKYKVANSDAQRESGNHAQPA